MSKNNKKEGDVFKTPHDAVQNKLDKDFLNQQGKNQGGKFFSLVAKKTRFWR